MPAKLAPVYLENIKGYVDRNNEKLAKLHTNSAEYNRLKETIAEQKNKCKQVQSKYDGLTEIQRDTKRFFVEGMWYRYVYTLEEESEKVFGCWRPKLKPLPENPLDRLKPTDEEYKSKPKELQSLPKPKDKIEEYERFYIFLSSIHDNCLPEFDQISKDIWPDDLKNKVWHFCSDFFGDKTAFLNSALERVILQAGTGQVKTMLFPTIRNIVEIIKKLKILQTKVIDLINKKSIVLDDQVSGIVEGLSISSKVQQKEETKDNIAKILKTMQQAEIIRMQRKRNWPEDIKRLMNEIIVSLFPYLDFLKEKGTSGKWEQASIEYYIKSGKPSDLDDMIHEIEKIKHKMEVESQQSVPQKLGEIKKPTYSHIKSVSEYITQGESHTLEFKETFEYDIRQNQQNKNLNKASLKTIAAFLNTDGGTLLIGISDSGEVSGIQNDLQYVKGHEPDGFEQKLRHLINDRFDPSPLGNVQITFEELQEGIVCKVAVEQNREPIAFDDDSYIRDGNDTRKLKGRALTDWIQQRTKSK